MADKVVVVRLRAAVGEYTSGLARAGGQTVTFAGQVASAAQRQDSAMAQARTTMANLGQHAAAAGALIVAGIGGAMVVSAKAAIDFESSLAGVAKTVEGTEGQIIAIGEAMRHLSTSIPVNVNSLNRIAELGGQLGIEIPNLVEFTEVIAALGVTTNLSTEEAATGLARLANVTGESQDNFDRLGSVIVDLGNNFATTESEILTFGLRIAPAAQTVGATAQEVLGLSAALSSMGVPAERGGTAVQTMFTIIAGAARSGGEELETMATITGMAADEFAALAKDSPTDALVALAEGLGEANAEGQNVFTTMRAMGIMGRRAQAVLLAMANNTTLLKDALALSNEAYDENNALFEEAARRYGTTASEIQILANRFTDLRIEIGQGLLPGISDLVGILGELFRWLKDNAEVAEVFGTILKSLLFLGLVAGMTKLVGSVISLGTALKGAVQLLGIFRAGAASAGLAASSAAGPIGVVLAIAVGALGTLAFNAAKRMAELRENADQFATAIQQGEEPVQAFLDTLDPERIGLAAEGLALVNQEIQDIGQAGAGLNVSALESTLKALQDERAEIESRARYTAGERGGEKGLTPDEESRLAAVVEAIEIVEEAIGTAEMFVSDRSAEMARAVLIAGKQGTRGFDDLRVAAEAYLKLRPDATDQDFLDRIANFSPPPANEIELWKDRNSAALQAVRSSWQGWLSLQEGGFDRQIDFFEGVGDAAEDWAADVNEALDDVRENLLDSQPAWDEYEKVTTLNLDAVFKSLDNYNSDLADWASVQTDLMGMASDATLEWLSQQDVPTLAALARAWNTGLRSMEDDIARWNAQLGTSDDILTEIMLTNMPRIVREAAGSIPAVMEGLVDALKLPENAEFYTQAYEDGLMAFFAALPAEFGPYIQRQIALMLDPDDPEHIRQQGEKYGAFFIDGLNLAIANGEIVIKPAVEELAESVPNIIAGKWTADSPSKVAIGLGEDFTEGLMIGLGRNVETDLAQRIIPSFQSLLSQPSSSPVTNDNKTEIVINHPNHPTDDLTRDLQRASVLAGFQRIAESRPLSN